MTHFLQALNVLGGLGDIATIPPGTVIEWVGYVTRGVFQVTQDPTPDLLAQVEGAIYQQDWFITAAIDPLSGKRIRIVAMVRNGFAQLADAQAAIEGALYSYTADADGSPFGVGTDSIRVWRWPAGYQPTGGQAIQPRADMPPDAIASYCSNPSLFCPCGQEFSLWDWGCVPFGKGKTAAQALGIGAGSAGMAGVVIALIAVIAINKLVK